MSQKEESTFENLNKIDVNSKVKKKGNFSYLSWAFAWEELKKVAPDSTAKVYENEAGLPYFADGDTGIIVKVGVTVGGIEHISYLPVMNYSNKAMKASEASMMDINKAIQRATVKAISLHGLGLYIYAGEDEPTGDENPEDASDKKESAFTPLVVGDANWAKARAYTVKNKAKGLPEILKTLKTKYSINAEVEAELKKATA